MGSGIGPLRRTLRSWLVLIARLAFSWLRPLIWWSGNGPLRRLIGTILLPGMYRGAWLH